MSADSLILLAAASLLLLLAHILRAARWALLFPVGYLTQRFNLLLGLAMGYVVNLVLPFRLGELVRAALVSRRDGVRFSFVAATIVVERMTDLVVVSAMISAILVDQGPDDGMFWTAPAAMAAAAVAVVTAALLIHRSLRVRTMMWRFASVFNDRLAIAIADFIWSFAEIVLSFTVLRWRYVTSSLVMWGLYLAAYAVLGRAIGVSTAEVVQAMLGAPLVPFAERALTPHGGAEAWLMLLVFVTAPIAAIIAYAFVRSGPVLGRGMGRAMDMVRLRGKSGVDAPFALRNRFIVATAYERFLAALFSGSDQLVTGYWAEAIGDCVVHKFFNGGSDAITALVEKDGRLVIRKFAVAGAAGKLKVQAEWLHQHSNAALPLVRVVKNQETSRLYLYDMPMVTPANDFYDVIHTSSSAQNSALLARVLDSIAAFHELTVVRDVDAGVIDSYLHVKAAQNAELIENFARQMIGGEVYDINDIPYSFAFWRRLSDPAWLRAQIRDPHSANIHGDLTIENIIIAPDMPLGFYIIDPNPENVFNSPLIDWAKLMQSLHLGYETLNRGLSCKQTDQLIYVSLVRSDAYATLHSLLEMEVMSRFGEDALREVYFHEIINYLRLTTYKIRQSSIRGLGFFACTNILLKRYVERWG